MNQFEYVITKLPMRDMKLASELASEQGALGFDATLIATHGNDVILVFKREVVSKPTIAEAHKAGRKKQPKPKAKKVEKVEEGKESADEEALELEKG